MRPPRDRDLHGDQTAIVALDLVANMTTSWPRVPLCSAPSMLFAFARPRVPRGLRALTAPARSARTRPLRDGRGVFLLRYTTTFERANALRTACRIHRKSLTVTP